jgi:hypothetical protein
LDFNLYAVQQAQKSWVDFAPILVSILALAISLWIAIRQIQIQRWQLNKDLFDRRFSVYTETRAFLTYANGLGQSFTIHCPQYDHFRETKEKAEMLLPAEVYDYLVEIDKAASDLGFASKKLAAKPDDPELIQSIEDLSNRLQTLPQRRTDVFRASLKMPSFDPTVSALWRSSRLRKKPPGLTP